MSDPHQSQTPANPQSDKPLAHQPNIKSGPKSADDGQANADTTPPPRMLRSFFNLELFFDFLLIVVTAVYVFFAFHQWKAIDRQADLMTQQLAAFKDSSAQTERLIKANEELAKLNASLVKNSGEQVKASITQAEAATQQAKIAQQSFFIGDRPYLTASAIIEKFEPGSSQRIGVGFINNGKTPALDIQISAIVNIEKSPSPDLKRYSRMSIPEIIAEQLPFVPYPNMPEGSQFFLAAGGKTMAEINTPELTSKLVDDIKLKRQFLLVWGGSQYKDGLGRRHVLRFCLFYNPEDDIFVACPTFNSTQ